MWKGETPVSLDIWGLKGGNAGKRVHYAREPKSSRRLANSLRSLRFWNTGLDI
jgi:hypothetical protein